MTEPVAMTLARHPLPADAIAARGDVHSGVQCYRVEDGGAPVDLPDPLTSGTHQRYRFLVQITLRIRRPQGGTP